MGALGRAVSANLATEMDLASHHQLITNQSIIDPLCLPNGALRELRGACLAGDAVCVSSTLMLGEGASLPHRETTMKALYLEPTRLFPRLVLTRIPARNKP